MNKNLIAKINGKKIYFESEHLQIVCDNLTFNFNPEYINIDSIDDLVLLESSLGDLQYHLAKIESLIDSIEERISEINEEEIIEN